MANHDAHISSRNKLPPCPFWPLRLEARGIPEVDGVSLEVRHGQHERKRVQLVGL